jgi:two-component system CheB/CheR fusion protein
VTPHELRLESARVDALLAVLELMAAGDTEQRLPISPLHDELDAVAYCINVLVGELGWTARQVSEAQEARAAELHEAVASARNANAAKNTFLRNVSHEVRTPIAAMVGFADLLASPDLTPEDRADLVRRLQANGQAVLSLLGDLLDLERLDAEKVLLEPTDVCVFELVREVLSSAEIETRAKGLDVRLETNDMLGTIRTDRYRLRQILVNLVSNAVKFTPAGNILVSIRSLQPSVGDQWIIDVADTGIGIAPERHRYLFEPFEQADSTIVGTYGGTGLGLALSRKLAARLGGWLMLVRSAPNQGTTFRLTVGQLGDAPRPEPEPAPQPTAPDVEDLTGLRILLAEDHADMQTALRRLVTLAGASVEVVSDGRQAIAKAKSTPVDVVLMDLRMPHMDGLEATRLLRGEGFELPIIALTADPATLRRAQALAAGCDDCLSKPFSQKELVASIRSLRARKRPSN